MQIFISCFPLVFHTLYGLYPFVHNTDQYNKSLENHRVEWIEK